MSVNWRMYRELIQCMSLFKDIRLKIANRMLNSELKAKHLQKEPFRFMFDKVKTVGIIFDATSPEDFELVKRYVVYLREFSKKVKVLGYFNTKNTPALTYSKLEYDFFTVKDVNWLYKPNAMVVKNFINEEFDLLIDLNVHDRFPIKYISALSKAKFKVGKYIENEIDIYDMMIDADNTKTIKYFLRQVDTYITMMNKVEPNLN